MNELGEIPNSKYQIPNSKYQISNPRYQIPENPTSERMFRVMEFGICFL
jgi:hypothetical protein